MVILFDLDGTLLDSEKVARAARSFGFQAILGRQVTNEEEAFFIGKPVRKVLAEWFPDHAAELSATIRSQYMNLSPSIQPYAGVLDMLKKLKTKGVTLGIVSSKRNNNIELELKSTGLAAFFEIIVGQDDTVKHKPDPEPLLLALKRLNASPASCTYIGDQPTDVLAAHQAGVRPIAAVWGEGDEKRFLDGMKTLIARTPGEILNLTSL